MCRRNRRRARASPGLTAYSVVVSLAGTTAGDRVLVLGASGGVGLPVVSLAARLGARVWGQTGNPAKADTIRELGAVEAVITDADELGTTAAQVRPTVIIDALGGDFTPAALNLLEQHGRYVVYGVSAGAQVTVDLRSVYRRSIHLLGYSGFGLTTRESRRRLDLVLDALADRAVTGKIVLALDS